MGRILAAARLAPAVAWLTLGAALGTPSGAAAAPPAGPDTVGWRFETGASSDGTNEIFYESTLIDTTFLPRQRVSDPEVRYAGVGLVAVQGTRGSRFADYLAQTEVSVGDLVRRGDLRLSWRQGSRDRWRLQGEQRLEYRDDHTFGRSLRTWREDFSARARHGGMDGEARTEAGYALALQRSRGDTTGLFLDNLLNRVFVAWEKGEILGREWGGSYSVGYRVFADSSNRDHFEHVTRLRWREPLGYRGEIESSFGFTRRQTRDFVPTTRDNYWLGSGSIEASLRPAEGWRVTARGEVEDTRYDQPSETYFEYSLVSARLGARFEPALIWSLELVPRGTFLHAPRQRAEEYDEGAVEVPFTWIGRRAYFSILPGVGRRNYHGVSGDALQVEHSSYNFVNATTDVDMPLGAGLRLRGSAGARWEEHTVADDDARSLYFSLDLRRIF